jgi:hypothetical protein
LFNYKELGARSHLIADADGTHQESDRISLSATGLSNPKPEINPRTGVQPFGEELKVNRVLTAERKYWEALSTNHGPGNRPSISTTSSGETNYPKQCLSDAQFRCSPVTPQSGATSSRLAHDDRDTTFDKSYHPFILNK